MKLKFHKHALIAAAVLALASSCSDDKDTPEMKDPPLTSSKLTGEWIDAAVTDQYLAITVSGYNEDGTLNVWEALTARGMNTMENVSGSWNLDGDQLSESYSQFGTPSTFKYTVDYADSYSLAIHDENGIYSVLSRVVGTYDMKPGEKRRFTYDGYDFHPYAYSAIVPSAVNVDESGTITATENGIGFVKASGLEGDLVVRVDVMDPDCILNPYENLIGQPSASAEKAFGPYFSILPGASATSRSFEVFSNVIEGAFVQSALNRVQLIIVTIRQDIDMAQVRKSLVNRFGEGKMSDPEDWFKVVDVNGTRVAILLNAESNAVQYMQYEQ